MVRNKYLRSDQTEQNNPYSNFKKFGSSHHYSLGSSRLPAGSILNLFPAHQAEKFSKAEPVSNGGASRDRTDDPLLAKQVLSQLSYSPEFQFPSARYTG